MKQILFFILCISLVSAAFAETEIDKNAQLIQAAKDNNFAAVQTLLAGGADVNAKRSTDGTTVLMWAALNGNTEIVKLLLEKGADINAKSNDGLTALAAARSNGHTDIVQLLEKPAAPAGAAEKDVPEKKTESLALHIAAYEGNLEEVKALIAKGADVNTRWPKDSNFTPLFFAVTKGNEDMRKQFDSSGFKKFNEVKDITKTVDYPRLYTDIVSLLLANGADINAKASGDWTALNMAARFGNLDIAELLIAKGADINAKTSLGATPLWLAFANNHKDIGNLLIAKGAKVDISIASTMGDIERVKAFLKSDPNMINTTRSDFTPLHEAAYSGQTEMVKFLIEKGVDVNAGYPKKPTPLYWAATKGHLDIVELLISKGADMKSEEFPPLRGAAMAESKEAVELLIAKGADVNVKDSRGFTPLFAAVIRGNKDIAELLIAKGADVNAKNSRGFTPLFLATDKDRKDIAELLIAKGADVNARAQDGRTPLFFATNKDFAELLIAKGADINAKDNSGTTPPVVAENEGYPEIAKLMRNYQDKSKSEKPAANEISSPNNITFKSSEKAPEAFDAWSFRWVNPTGDSDANFWYVVIQPDGQEYFRYDLPDSAASHNTRSDFKAGSAGGDPRVFYNEYIRFSVCASKGKLVFPQSDSVPFKFEFFQKDAQGKIDWNKPFKTIDAIIEPPAALPEGTPSTPKTEQPITEKVVTFKSAKPAPENFVAWCFEGMAPIGDANAVFSFTAVQPDGKECGWGELPKSKNRYFKLYSKPGSPGDDVRVFYNEFVRLKIRPDSGDAIFSQSDIARCKFQFFRKNAAGEINWKAPFKVIDAVIEP